MTATEHIGRKFCRKCQSWKLFEEFGIARRRRDGLQCSCKKCTGEYWKAYRNKDRDNLEKIRASHRNDNMKRRFGLTVADYEAMLALQGGVCGICKAATSGRRNRRFTIDHDHETGQIRGLLCITCNMVLGVLGDNEKGVMRALEYLQKAKSQPRLVPMMAGQSVSVERPDETVEMTDADDTDFADRGNGDMRPRFERRP